MEFVHKHADSHAYNRRCEQLLTRCCRCDQSRTSSQAWIWWCSQVGLDLSISLYVCMMHQPISCSRPFVLWNCIVVQPLFLSVITHSLVYLLSAMLLPSMFTALLKGLLGHLLICLHSTLRVSFNESKPNWVCFCQACWMTLTSSSHTLYT